MVGRHEYQGPVPSPKLKNEPLLWVPNPRTILRGSSIPPTTDRRGSAVTDATNPPLMFCVCMHLYLHQRIRELGMLSGQSPPGPPLSSRVREVIQTYIDSQLIGFGDGKSLCGCDAVLHRQDYPENHHRIYVLGPSVLIDMYIDGLGFVLTSQISHEYLDMGARTVRSWLICLGAIRNEVPTDFQASPPMTNDTRSRILSGIDNFVVTSRRKTQVSFAQQGHQSLEKCFPSLIIAYQLSYPPFLDRRLTSSHSIPPFQFLAPRPENDTSLTILVRVGWSLLLIRAGLLDSRQPSSS